MFLICQRHILLILTAAFVTGCTQTRPGFWQNRSDSYIQIDADQLLSFGANMANAPPATRAELCKSLLMRQRETQDAGIQLHLMVGRLLSDSCGSIPRIIEGVSKIPAHELSDPRLHRLISIHTEALKRMDATPIRQSGSRIQPSRAQTPRETKSVNQDENRLLREKLEAIRAMEKQLDESVGGN